VEQNTQIRDNSEMLDQAFKSEEVSSYVSDLMRSCELKSVSDLVSQDYERKKEAEN